MAEDIVNQWADTFRVSNDNALLLMISEPVPATQTRLMKDALPSPSAK